MASKIDRIAHLLASGLTTSITASVAGVSPAYVSQLKADPDFQAHVNELKMELVEEESTTEKELTTYSDKLLGAEHKVVDHILDRLNMMEDRTAIAALREIGARHDAMRKQALVGTVVKDLGKNGGTLRMIELTIPAVAAPDLHFGSNNEIVQIGNRSIAPMPTATLQKIIDGESLSILEGEYNEQDFISQAIDSL